MGGRGWAPCIPAVYAIAHATLLTRRTPTATAAAHNKETRRRCGPMLVKRLAWTPPR